MFHSLGPHGEEGADEEAGGNTDDNADVVVGPDPGAPAPAPTPSTSNPSPTSSTNDIPAQPPIGFVPHPTEINRKRMLFLLLSREMNK